MSQNELNEMNTTAGPASSVTFNVDTVIPETTGAVDVSLTEPTLNTGSFQQMIWDALPFLPDVPNEEEVMRDIYQKFSHVDTSQYLRKKESTGGKTLSYLSWAKAWDIVLSYFPDAQNDILMFDGKPYWDMGALGCVVVTAITIRGVRRFMWLPVMAMRNDPIHIDKHKFTRVIKGVEREFETEALDTSNLNKSLMRCLVKNLAMFGLGINLYNGDDLPDSVRESRKREEDEQAELMSWVVRVADIAKQKFAGHKAEVQDILIRYADGSTNPKDIKDVAACKAAIKELNALKEGK